MGIGKARQVYTLLCGNHKHSRQAQLVRAQNLQQKVAIRFLARHVLLELIVVSQEHLQEAAFLSPHLKKKKYKESTKYKQIINNARWTNECSGSHLQ